jgi:uncharacterized protein involved in outer membrane biogenesis
MKKNKKLQLWFVWAVRITLALIASGLLLASLYINSEPMQKRIGAIIAREMGDVVKFERADLSIFPRPGLAFYQVSINIPAGTSIRAESAKIYPQILPLLIGKVRIAKVKLEEPDIIVDILEKPQQKAVKDNTSSPAEVLENVTSVISSVQSVAPGLVAVVHRGKLLVRENNYAVAVVRKIYARIAFEPEGVEIKFKGDTDKWGEFSVRGNIHMEKNNILINGLSINTITMNNVQASVFDSSFVASAVISETSQAINSADVTMSGKIGPETIRLVSQTFRLPPEQTLHAPVSISNTHIVWQAGAKLAITAEAAIEGGPTLSVALSKNATDLAISQLMIYDKESQANIAFTYTKNLIDVSFKGSLTEKTLNRIFEHSSFHRGWIKGDFRAHVQLDQYGKSTAQGHLEGADFIISLPMNVPLKVRRVILSANNKTLKVESATLNWGENNLDLKGNVVAAQDGFRLDMDLSADAIKVETIAQNLISPEKPQETKPSEKHSKKPALRGIIRLNAPSITWGRYTASPLHANILLDNKGINVNITEAFLCGISIPGNLTFGKENDIQLDFKPAAAGKRLEPTLDCLFYEDSRITGLLNLQAAVNSRGKSDALLSSLQGRVEFLSKDGIIYRFHLLAKIFSFLNITELLRGKIPDFGTEGFKYNSMTIKGNIRQGIFLIQEAVIDGTTMQLVGQGEINLTNNKINLTILVAPFKTVDFLVSKIPLVGYILKGTLISIPLKVTGDLAEPTIIVLSPTAVGEGLLGIMKRTLSLPVKIIEPVIPRNKKEEK